ncbi:MAG: beta-lactamase family protein [Alphaproteobacteria bacterium]|nr:beta-lactamase family protein [Alphaproteobacteria bacterium]
MRWTAFLAGLLLAIAASAGPAVAANPVAAAATANPIATATPAPLGPNPPVASAAPVPAHELTQADLSAFLDGFLPTALGRGDIAGAVVVVVRDGHVLVEKGYGVADMKSGKPVDPMRTMFRPGSISKLFTWTAVMQQVEQGKLNLDADVNTYLDFKIPGKKVTLRNLMTHTSGFEETIKRLFTEDPTHNQKLGEGLKAWVPEQLFAPGTTPAYSNYGAALAGYIVERVSGETFEDYVARHIFQPLGMTHSSFVQPLPKNLSGDMSSGYDKASGDAKKFEIIWMAPAGALSASGDDIAKFMIAYLSGGGAILKPETVKLMHSEIYQRDPMLPGIGLGFYHEDTNGHVVVGHAGDTVAFHSDLHLIPDAGIGFFYSQNGAGKENSGIWGPLFRAFMDRYLPGPAQADEPTLKTAHAHGVEIAGMYDNSRRSDSSFFRVANQQSKVALNDDDTISVGDFPALNGEPRKWREVRPYVWREVGGQHLLIAKRKDGRVAEIASDLYPQVWVYSPSSFWDSQAWNIPLLVATVAMLLLTVAFWPIKALLRWRYQARFPYEGRAATVYRLTRVVALIDLVFLGGFFAALLYGSEHLAFFDPANDWIFFGLEALGIVAIVSVVVPLYEFMLALGDSERPWWTKVTDLMILAAAVATIWFAVTLNFVNFHMNY